MQAKSGLKAALNFLIPFRDLNVKESVNVVIAIMKHRKKFVERIIKNTATHVMPTAMES